MVKRDAGGVIGDVEVMGDEISRFKGSVLFFY